MTVGPATSNDFTWSTTALTIPAGATTSSNAAPLTATDDNLTGGMTSDTGTVGAGSGALTFTVSDWETGTR